MTDLLKIENQINAVNQQVTELINKTNEEVENSAKLGRENTTAINELNAKLTDFNAQLTELAQNGLQIDGGEQIVSPGNQFVGSDAFKNMVDGRSNKARLEMQNNTITGSDVTVAPDRQAGVVGGAFRQFTIANVMPQYTTTSNAIEYTRENVFTNNAAEAAEGTQKGETAIDFELVSTPVRTIAHFIKLSKQLLDDAPAIAAYVDGRMRYGVDLREENQMIAGDGVGANLSGMLKAGNYTVFTATTGDKAADSIRRAMAQVEAADYMATAVILNPQDAMLMDLQKDTGGAYVSNNLSARGEQLSTAWGLPVIRSNSIAQGQFLVGAFDMATALWRRQGIVVDLFEQDGDNAQKNLVTLRAEKRCALSIYRPASLVGGTLLPV